MFQHIHRRECLQLGLATMLGAPLLAADKPANKFKFGFSLYGMRSLRLDDALSACAKIGYDAVELASIAGWPADPAKLDKDARKALRERIADLKLTTSALMENLPLDVEERVYGAQLERLKAVTELAHDLAPDTPPVVETVLGGKPDQWDKVRDLFAKRLADWAKIAEASRTIVAIKPHRFGAMNLPEHAAWLLDQVKSPWIRLVYDWSHYDQRNLSMKDTLHAVVPKAAFVHVKDTVFVKDKPAFVLPGEGTTDYVQLLTGLKEEGYSGCVCVEVSAMVFGKKDYDPIAAAKKCYEKLAPAFEKAGVR